jgi:hypothetical protein
MGAGLGVTPAGAVGDPLLPHANVEIRSRVKQLRLNIGNSPRFHLLGGRSWRNMTARAGEVLRKPKEINRFFRTTAFQP